MTDEKSILITKIKLNEEGRVELYGKGHKYPDLTLFDPAELILVGIDCNTLDVGITYDYLFLAHYELGEKLNQHGNPYKNVTALSLPDEVQVTRPGSHTVNASGDSAVVNGLRELYRQQSRIIDQLCTQTDMLESMGNKLARVEDHLGEIAINTKGEQDDH